jgi:hypothetical protein
MGMAMMGSATGQRLDRARIAAEQAVACPLLEGVDLPRRVIARGVLRQHHRLVARQPKMKDEPAMPNVMNTIPTPACARCSSRAPPRCPPSST